MIRSTSTTLRVQVLDREKTPVRKAKITVAGDEGRTVLTRSDPKGFYVAEKGLPEGDYEITVEKKPYEPQTRTVRLEKDQHTEVFFLMSAGTSYFYRGHVRTPFSPDEDRIALVVSEKDLDADESKKKSRKKPEPRDAKLEKIARERAKKHELKLESGPEPFRKHGVFLCRFPEGTTKERKQKIRDELEKESPNSALPVVTQTDRYVTMLTNELLVMFEDDMDEEAVKSVADDFGLRIKRKMASLGNLYHLSTGEAPTYDSLELVNRLAEEDGVVFAEPNLSTAGEEDAITPTDYLFPEQWDHGLIGTRDAWQFLSNINVNRRFGSPDIIVGVVDSGVDTDHPDFSGNVSDGSAKIYEAFDFANMVDNTDSRSSDHGTCCASAAAAMANNASAVGGTNEGVAGVAGNCRVLAIRRDWPGTEAGYADMYLWAAGFDPDSDDDDFPDPISPGADILTNSINHPGSGSPISGTMSAVFDKLTDDGRDGKGVLLFFSAANAASDNDTAFDRPWGMYDRCFSIAASTLANDGTTEIQAGYSNFSSVTEVCAPSHDQYVSNAPLHNPNANFGAFTATDADTPNGHGTVGRPATQTTLSAAANAGNNVVTLASVAGIGNGQAILFGAPGGANTEAHLVNNVDAGTNQVTLNRNLFNNQASGTAVAVANHDYRSNFGGTSHSTPLCAGTAALMLSANPGLTWTQVRDILRDTAAKINPGETNANGRWQDAAGNLSNSPAYDGNPVFSEFYGYGRIDAALAVRQSGWDIELVTQALDFNDVPEGDTVARAIRFNVKSLWPATFNVTAGPGAPFTALSTSEVIGSSSDYNVPREVYFWVTYQGTSEGDEITPADGYTITIQNPETEQEWVIPITANVIGSETAAVMLSLDQSGSMNYPSGIGSASRIEVLRLSANVMIDVLKEDNGLGIVSFDQNPHDVLGFIGPVGPPTSPTNPYDQDRADMKTAINNFDPNPSGMTAIGDGIERALTRLNPVTGYDSKSVIVFTDGKETAEKYISQVAGQITDRIFAIGLGKAHNINPAALNEIANSSGGYMLLADDLGSDSVFKLSKYFLQIQAAINNEDIVVDPDGTLFAGQEHRVPFHVNEADITTDIIAMVPNPGLVNFHLETPNGEIVHPGQEGTVPGVTYGYGRNVVFYRLNLPLPVGVPEREGTWQAVLRMNEKGHRAWTENFDASAASGADGSGSSDASIAHVPTAGSIPYSLLVHARSNLRMETLVSQTHYEPGATVTLSAILTQFGIPLTTPCSVKAEVVGPNGQASELTLASAGDGRYEATFPASVAGVYQIRIKAEGRSLRGRAFTREQVRSAAVWRGGNQPSPTGSPGAGGDGGCSFCDIVRCLLNERVISDQFRKRMQEVGIDLKALEACLEACCQEGHTQDKPALERLKEIALWSKLKAVRQPVD